MAGLGTWALSDVLSDGRAERSREATARVMKIDDAGIAWFLAGRSGETDDEVFLSFAGEEGASAFIKSILQLVKDAHHFLVGNAGIAAVDLIDEESNAHCLQRYIAVSKFLPECPPGSNCRG